MEPGPDFTRQVTAVLVLPVTVAVNRSFWLAVSVYDCGATETETEEPVSVMVDFPDLVVSATLVAVTVTVVEVEIEAGAV
jgi:hypothetical protein